MIYQYTKRYLRKKYKKPKVDFIWTQSYNTTFLKYVERRYTKDELLGEILEVKEAFKDFFEPVGVILFKYTPSKGIRVKVLAYSVHPKDSKYLSGIVRIIGLNKKHVKHPYQGLENQIGILGKIRRAINANLADIKESVNKKELIKYAIRKSLKLNDEDVIVLLKRTYIVKIVEKVVRTKAEEEELARYGGYTQDQLEEVSDTVFANVTLDEFIKNVMDGVFKKYLNFNTATNKFYESKVILMLHKEINEELNNYLSLDDDFIKAFAGYFMREQFYKFHEIMAIRLLEDIHSKEGKAEEFLHYYNGKVILENGKKYQIPSLNTADGQRWNNSAILGICSLFITNKSKTDEIYEKMKKADIKIATLAKELEPAKIEKKAIFAEIANVETQMVALKNIAKEQIEKAKEEQESDIKPISESELKEKLKVFETLIINSKKSINNINQANRDTSIKYKFFIQKKSEFEAEIASYDSNLGSNRSKVDEIIKSIATALMSRRKLIA